MLIEAYADGSATVATKPGGYGWVIVVNGEKYSEGFGHIPLATNNDAELEGAIQVLAQVLRLMMNHSSFIGAEVHLRCDSQIVLNWANNTSKFTQKHKVAKYDALRSLMIRTKAKTVWVEGHSGHEHNERCDKLANIGRLNTTEIEFDASRKSKRKKKPNSLSITISMINEDTISILYKNNLKIVKLDNNIIEDYDKAIHGDLVKV